MNGAPDGDEASRGSRDRARSLTDAVTILAVSIPVALVGPFLFIRLIGRAQSACLDLEGYNGAYLAIVWIGLVIVSGWLVWVGALLAWRLRLVVRLAAGVGLVLVLGLVATWQLVPSGSPSDYRTTTSQQCGPGGIPTWWPPILPHR